MFMFGRHDNGSRKARSGVQWQMTMEQRRDDAQGEVGSSSNRHADILFAPAKRRRRRHDGCFAHRA